MFDFQRKLLAELFDQVETLKEHFAHASAMDEIYLQSLEDASDKKLQNEYLAFQKDAEDLLRSDLKELGSRYRAIGKLNDEDLMTRALTIIDLLPERCNPLRDEEADQRWKE